ncbi:SDR family NAD(P)-dependent oxidoreductase [Nocardioides fonticola]|uniref:SDR family NAD(P)-dependent oxidoreductase n=1 Tax=Nocardioides fonticola TaxID=450363 RepID=A0ABP7Y2M5_9ACTN
MSRRTAVIVGAGPGVSGSLARLYADAGWNLALFGSHPDAVGALADDLRERGAAVDHEIGDLADVADTDDKLRSLAERAEEVGLLHFNPSVFREADALELSVADLLADVAIGVGGLLTAVQAVVGSMGPGARVSATGSMAADQPWHRAATLGVQKAGLRNLVLGLDTTLTPSGIRAVSVTVRGALGSEGAFTPDKVAAAIYAATWREDADWTPEVSYEG